MKRQRDQVRFGEYLKYKSKELDRAGRRQTAANYLKLDKSLQRYLESGYADLCLDGITEELISSYETYLKSLGVSLATVSFYNRIFRSVYNQAAKDSLVKNTHPFDSAYTKVIAPRKAIMVDVGGVRTSLESQTKEEIIRQYTLLAEKHNRLVGALRGVVKV